MRKILTPLPRKKNILKLNQRQNKCSCVGPGAHEPNVKHPLTKFYASKQFEAYIKLTVHLNLNPESRLDAEFVGDAGRGMAPGNRSTAT